MLDHVLLDVIAGVREAFEAALLERQAVEERFQVDVFLGDISWETSYSLPGEGDPPRVRADLSLDWPTWSQSAYRSWSIGEPPEEPPELAVELALRIQRLAEAPGLEEVLSSLPPAGAAEASVGPGTLQRSGATVERIWEESGRTESAVEVAFQGSWRFEDRVLEEPGLLQDSVGAFGRWVASALVRLGDLPLRYLPPEPPSDAE